MFINPNHIALALKYDRVIMVSPMILAKGYDTIAQQI